VHKGPNGLLIQTNSGLNIAAVRPVKFGEALAPGTPLTLFSDDKPERLFTVSGVPSYQVEDGERQNSFTASLAN
jgi:hypothetical protein